MNNFISVKKLKKEPYVPTCDVSCAQHCAMNVALEEVLELIDLNLLVIGVGECAFYSQKQPLGGKRRNWAYNLTDREIVFGDMQGVEDAIRNISTNGLKTVCVATCIPLIMNLDVESIVENIADTIVINAPDFKGVSPYDILGEFYFQLLKSTDVNCARNVSVWDKDFDSVDSIIKNLQAKVHIVRNTKYLKVLEYLSKKYSLEIIDDTHFQSMDFYKANKRLLGVSDETLCKIYAIVEKLKGKRLNIKSAKAYEYALFLKNNNCEIGTIVFSVYNEDAYNRCNSLGQDVYVSPDYRSELPVDGAINIDLSKFDEEIFHTYGANRLCKLLEKTEEICL